MLVRERLDIALFESSLDVKLPGFSELAGFKITFKLFEVLSVY
jgi:hypothetical protein